MDVRGETSKLTTSIESCIISYGPCSVLNIDKPSFSKREEVESALKVFKSEELEHIENKVSSSQASRSRGISKEFLSKLQLVYENLAEKEIERNAQLRLQSKDNPSCRNHTTNDRMLRCKRLQSVFFIEIIFLTKHKYAKGKKCCQVFASDKDCVTVYLMKSQDKFETALH